MDIRQFRYFLGVADAGNFTKAAAALHVSQPALSQQIKDLEDRLGVRVFDRSPHGLRITDAGAIVVEHARRATASVEALRQSIEEYLGLRRGRVRIGVLQTFNAFYLPAIAAEFLRKHPDIDLEVLELRNDEIEERVAAGDLHLGVILADRRTHRSKLTLYSEELTFVCAPEHPLSVSSTVALQSLMNERVGVLTKGFATRTAVDSLLHSQRVRPRRLIEFNTISGILAAVSTGACVSITPADARRVAPSLGLHFSNIKPKPPRRTICLVKGPEGLRTPAADAFADAIGKHFSVGRRARQTPPKVS